MKIAVLSDIHGNHYALAEVLKTVRKERIERLLVLGDIVGYYYHAFEALEMLRAWQFDFVKGNHEEILGQILANEQDERQIRLKYGSGHRLAIETLSQSDLKWLVDAPSRKEIEIAGVKMLMCHGAPWQSDFYLYPDTSSEILDKCEQPGIDFVTVGHSHYSFIYPAGRSLLVNVGSVGQSRSMGGLANWAVINVKSRTVEIRSTPYDVEPLLKQVARVDPDIAYLKEILTRNRSINV